MERLVPYSMHFRRPSAKGVDPFAGPGGTDYTPEVVPNSRFDCEPISALFRDSDLLKVRACIASVKEPREVLFRLRRDPAPFFALEERKDTPDCIKDLIPRIPVPREIFFEAFDDGVPSCYGARLNIEEDELFWVKLPIARKVLRLTFPLDAVPSTDEETTLLLLSWSIAPFWTESPRALRAIYVPDALCDKCLGRKNRLNPLAPPPVLWP